jgi:hypothetical protein
MDWIHGVSFGHVLSSLLLKPGTRLKVRPFIGKIR